MRGAKYPELFTNPPADAFPCHALRFRFFTSKLSNVRIFQKGHPALSVSSLCLAGTAIYSQQTSGA